MGAVIAAIVLGVLVFRSWKAPIIILLAMILLQAAHSVAKKEISLNVRKGSGNN